MYVQGEVIDLVCVQGKVTPLMCVQAEVNPPVCGGGGVSTALIELVCVQGEVNINQSALCEADRQRKCAYNQELPTNPQGFKSLPNKLQFVKNPMK